jgi:hypothetical protein
MSVRAAIDRAVRGHELPADLLETAFGEITAGEATPVQIAALLAALRTKGETRRRDRGHRARAARAAAVTAPCLDPRTVDTCGTGGDGAHTFNISTTAAFVVAGAGVPVAKHGNRAASSKSGSIDVLEALGVVVELDVAASARVLKEVGIAPFFARIAHPAMRHVAPVRQELGIRTLMNCMGPLLNPLGVRRPDDRRVRPRARRRRSRTRWRSWAPSACWSCTAATASTRSRSRAPRTRRARERRGARARDRSARVRHRARGGRHAARRRRCRERRDRARGARRRAGPAPRHRAAQRGGGAVGRGAAADLDQGSRSRVRASTRAPRARSSSALVDATGAGAALVILDEHPRPQAHRARRGIPARGAREARAPRRGDGAPLRDFARAIASGPEPRVIAEVKRRSPSRGEIRADFDPVACARAVRRGRRRGGLGAHRRDVLRRPPRLPRAPCAAVAMPLCARTS